ncbi:S-layer homology domain-containing protein [Lyngbya aestuarii]|uniref:S-layer homology domain-containing protein n=1 Tax=Lyngbya aestuarii TaxID=118322 RepID=UPI00403E2D84
MLFNQHPVIVAGLSAFLLGLLTSCAGNKKLENSFAADPQLKENSSLFGSPVQGNAQNQTLVQLPEDFPTEIPRYPEAKLEKVEALTAATAQGQQTVWSSSDPSNSILSFYKKEFETANWQIVSDKANEDGSSGTIVARRDDLKVTVSLPGSSLTDNSEETASAATPQTETALGTTEFDIEYTRDRTEASSQPSGEQESGLTPSSDANSSPETISSAKLDNSAVLEEVPQELREYVKDLTALGVLTANTSGSKTNQGTKATQFEPNKTITRREFARWLAKANNRIYANRPGLQIRLASSTTQPAFQDVPRTDPDFPVIQGLAETGLIPSPLSGDTTAVLFRPDAPLTRENLILWKVPLDNRQPLPSASMDAVKQTWGFQDTAKIDPKALSALLADFQNGEVSNVRRALGYTRLFQPKKPVTQAEAAAVLWYFGSQGEGVSANNALQLKTDNTQLSGTAESAAE